VSSEIPQSQSEASNQRSEKQISQAKQPTNDAVIAKWTKILGRSTIALFLATFGTGVVLYLTELTLRDTLTETRKAANAAKDSVEITKAVMQLDQRAWLGVESIRPEPLIPEIGKTFVVTMKVRNTGKTPARKITSRGRGEPVPKGGKPNFFYENIEPFAAHLMPGGESSVPIAPMTVPGTNTSVVVNKDIRDGLIAGTITVFVHGRLEYEDIFGKPHWVTYCASLFVPFNGQLGFCPDHNDTDDYQPAQK
jgi:hypothetical protein